MSLSYTKPTWTNDEGTAINAERLQAISNVLDGLVNQVGTKPIVHLSFSGTFMTATYADGSITTVENPLKGDKGDKGDTGATGPKGDKGDTGATGATGATGPQGEAGPQGPAGANGTNGVDGTDGTDGVSLTATSTKVGKTTTVLIKNADTEEVIDTLTIMDGSDGTGSGDMSKSEYASSTYGVVKKAETATSADSATTATNANHATSADSATTATSATSATTANTANNVAWANTNHPTTLEGYGLVSDVNALISTAIGDAIDGEY